MNPKGPMNLKRILFIVLCVLLALVLIMTVITVSQVLALLRGDRPVPTEPSASQTEPVDSSTEATDSSTDATEPSTEETDPSTEPSTAPSTQPTESTEAHVHSFDSVRSSKDPTCTDSGFRELVCACGEIKWEVLNKKDHSFGYGQVITATCETDGCTRYTCGVCGLVEDRNVVQALGHAYGTGVQHPATCEEDAYTEFTCANSGCPQPVMKEVADDTALGHMFGSVWLEQNGIKIQICTNCQATQTTGDLTITGSKFLDASDGSYRVHEIYVGTEYVPQMYVYKITDQVKGISECKYDYETGLTVSYTDNLGEKQTLVLANNGGQAVIAPTVPEDTTPSEATDPSEDATEATTESSEAATEAAGESEGTDPTQTS